MYSVIVPTIWNGAEFEYMLPKLLDHKLIGEVIIIDNAVEKRAFKIPETKKIVVLEQNINIFVNPAWNLGVKHARFDKICLMNDDIVFDTIVFDKLYDHVNIKNGVIGNKGFRHFYMPSEEMYIEPSTDLYNGYGVLMFVHKNNYSPIPEEFLINYGDIWLYDYNACQKRKNYEMRNFCVKTNMHSSAKHFKFQTLSEDSFFMDVFKKYMKVKPKGEFLTKPHKYPIGNI